MAGQSSPAECVQKARERGLPTEQITFSSDGQGSWSTYDKAGNLDKIGVASVSALHGEVKKMVLEMNFPLEEALTYVTSNVAKGLGCFPEKGSISKVADADIVLLDENLDVDTVIALGTVMMKDKDLLKKGTYE